MESTLTSSSPTTPRPAASAINASINPWNTPALTQLLNREYTVDQDPYRSGRSRHPAPVRKRQITPLNWSRTRRGNGPVAATGRRGSINIHSASVTSKRATPEFYQQPARQEIRTPNSS